MFNSKLKSKFLVGLGLVLIVGTIILVGYNYMGIGAQSDIDLNEHEPHTIRQFISEHATLISFVLLLLTAIVAAELYKYFNPQHPQDSLTGSDTGYKSLLSFIAYGLIPFFSLSAVVYYYVKHRQVFEAHRERVYTTCLPAFNCCFKFAEILHIT